MKSPRDILLGKYWDETQALDAIRRRALENVTPMNRCAAASDASRPSLAELFFRLRWHLLGLATVWAFIAVLSVLAASPQKLPPARVLSFAAQSATIARENRRMLNEMLRPAAAEASATTSGTVLPRSEIPWRFTTV